MRRLTQKSWQRILSKIWQRCLLDNELGKISVYQLENVTNMVGEELMLYLLGRKKYIKVESASRKKKR